MKTSYLFSVLVISFTVMITSCASTKNLKSKALQSRWEIQSVDSVSAAKVVASKAYIDFDLTKEKKGGAKAGCNLMFFNYEMLKGNKIKFSQVGSTMMHCPEMETEYALSKLIPLINNYEIIDTILLLKIDEKVVITGKQIG